MCRRNALCTHAAASSVAPIASGYRGSLRPCIARAYRAPATKLILRPPPDEERARAAVRGAERFLNAWHGGPAARGRLLEVAEAIDEEERFDRYGSGDRIERLEQRVAELLGKEAAVFMPSGTMAQPIALRIWSDRRGIRTVAFHPTCHLEIHEEKGYERLHGLHGKLVGDPNRLITLDDLEGIREPVAALLLELPQREIGGLLPSWDDLVAQVGWARERDVAMHLDGARLWESQPYYGRPHAEIAGLFDSVYVSFYKGLGGIAGAALAGDAALVAEARVWQRRQGGNLVTLHPFVVAAEVALDERLDRMPVHADHARALAAALAKVDGVEVVPDPPQTPLFHLLLRGDRERLADAALSVAEERKVFLFADPSSTTSPSWQRHEVMVGEVTLALEPAEVADLYAEVLARAAAPRPRAEAPGPSRSARRRSPATDAASRAATSAGAASPRSPRQPRARSRWTGSSRSVSTASCTALGRRPRPASARARRRARHTGPRSRTGRRPAARGASGALPASVARIDPSRRGSTTTAACGRMNDCGHVALDDGVRPAAARAPRGRSPVRSSPRR